MKRILEPPPDFETTFVVLCKLSTKMLHIFAVYCCARTRNFNKTILNPSSAICKDLLYQIS